MLPRGDVLFLEGDLAYPVATVHEVTWRLRELGRKKATTLELEKVLTRLVYTHYVDGSR